ncbi:hypothetical protein C8Q74DRAFT_1222123 [Fomes fomentarius]|nr:hypothetical protein C8Q74DRAFT_1222123 [Fomes fomentarius]
MESNEETGFMANVLTPNIQQLFNEIAEEQHGSCLNNSSFSAALIKSHLEQYATRDPRVLDELLNQPNTEYTVDMVVARILEYTEQQKSGTSTTRYQGATGCVADKDEESTSPTDEHQMHRREASESEHLHSVSSEVESIRKDFYELERRLKMAEESTARIEGNMKQRFKVLDHKLDLQSKRIEDLMELCSQLVDIGSTDNVHVKTLQTNLTNKMESLAGDLKLELLSCLAKYFGPSCPTHVVDAKEDQVMCPVSSRPSRAIYDCHQDHSSVSLGLSSGVCDGDDDLVPSQVTSSSSSLPKLITEDEYEASGPTLVEELSDISSENAQQYLSVIEESLNAESPARLTSDHLRFSRYVQKWSTLEAFSSIYAAMLSAIPWTSVVAGYMANGLRQNKGLYGMTRVKGGSTSGSKSWC